MQDMSRQPEQAPATGRRGLMAAMGLLAALGGAGLAWWRLMPRSSEPGAEAEFWRLEFETPAGQPLPVASFRGRPLLVNFWATWCPPCIEELPMLNDFYAQNSAKGWQVLGLAVDQPSAVRGFLARRPLQFPIAMAGLGGVELSKLLGNSAGGLPFTIIFRADGSIFDKKIGKVSSQNLATWRDLK